MSLKGNRGEWSEVYALLRILSDGMVRVTLGNGSESRTIVRGVFRKQSGKLLSLNISDEVIQVFDNDSFSEISRNDVFRASEILLGDIRSSKGAFESPETESILSRLRITRLKAESVQKADLGLVVHDSFMNQDRSLDFSVKSKLGSPPSLLNASGATVFRFKLSGDEPSIVSLAEADYSPRDFLRLARSRGVGISFDRMINEQFRKNLQLIDSGMPEIVASMIEGYYSGAGARMKDIVEFVVDADPLKIGDDFADVFYSHKVKLFLADCALGMTPTKKWTGTHPANGGYLVVESDGSIQCLNAFDRDRFHDYLYTNTKFDTPDNRRNETAKLMSYEVGPRNRLKFYVDLNLQVRFTS
jgi:hypothetical protein